MGGLDIPLETIPNVQNKVIQVQLVSSIISSIGVPISDANDATVILLLVEQLNWKNS